MSDKPVSLANGRVVFGLKELHIFTWLIGMAVVLWMTTAANSNSIKESKDNVKALDTRVANDHETLVKMTGDVGHLVDDVKAIKEEQVAARQEQTKTRESVQEQSGMLRSIQQSLASLSVRPPR